MKSAPEDEIVAFVYGPGRVYPTDFNATLDYYTVVRPSQANLPAVRFVPSGGVEVQTAGLVTTIGSTGDVADNRMPINGKFKISRLDTFSPAAPSTPLNVTCQYVDDVDFPITGNQPRSETYAASGDYRLRVYGDTTFIAPDGNKKLTVTIPALQNELIRVLLGIDKTSYMGVTPTNSAASEVTPDGLVCGSAQTVMQYPDNTYHLVDRPVVWAPSGGDNTVQGMVYLPLPQNSFGFNSALYGISNDRRRDPIGKPLFYGYGNTSQELYQVTAVVYAEMNRHRMPNNLGPYVGDTPHAIVGTAFPNWNTIRADSYVYDLNDATLVNNLAGRVLTSAIAVNKAGYIITKNESGNFYLLVPLIY